MVSVLLLGPVSIRVDQRTEVVRAARVRTILAVLALHPREVVPFDVLVDEMWPDGQLSNARNALQANVLRLRKLFIHPSQGDNHTFIRTVGTGYMLDVPADTVDARQFVKLVEDGSARVSRAPEEAIVLLRTALELWRGPALADAGTGLQCRAAAARLNDMRLTAREHFIDARLALGDVHGAVSDLRQLVAQFPERERFSEQLMLALYRCGRQSEALDVFRRTQHWLSSELGLDPSLALAEMHQAILMQDPFLVHRGTDLDRAGSAARRREPPGPAPVTRMRSAGCSGPTSQLEMAPPGEFDKSL